MGCEIRCFYKSDYECYCFLRCDDEVYLQGRRVSMQALNTESFRLIVFVAKSVLLERKESKQFGPHTKENII
jgi:hypothetical protein